MATTFDFQKQLEMGKEGEEKFATLYPCFNYNNDKDVMAPDFVHKKTGSIAEVKYDDSVRAKKDDNGIQLNFFVEQYSNHKEMTLGGPFRAVQEGVDYYVYMFKNPFRIFIFNACKFRDIAAELIWSNNYKQCFIKNKGWWTSGFPLPIKAFEEARVEGDILGKGYKLNII
jgi:hypothetical protein